MVLTDLVCPGNSDRCTVLLAVCLPDTCPQWLCPCVMVSRRAHSPAVGSPVGVGPCALPWAGTTYKKTGPSSQSSPLGPDHHRQRPPRGHRTPCTLASPATHPGPASLDPPHQVGPGPDTRHRNQRHTSRDHTPTTSPSGEGPAGGPKLPGAMGTGHRTNPRHRPPRRRPPHPRRQPPSPTYRQ